MRARGRVSGWTTGSAAGPPNIQFRLSITLLAARGKVSEGQDAGDGAGPARTPKAP